MGFCNCNSDSLQSEWAFAIRLSHVRMVLLIELSLVRMDFCILYEILFVIEWAFAVTPCQLSKVDFCKIRHLSEWTFAELSHMSE